MSDATSPHKNITQSLHPKITQSLHPKIMQPFNKKKSCNLPSKKIAQPLQKKSCNLSTKNHATSQQKNHATYPQKSQTSIFYLATSPHQKSCNLSSFLAARSSSRSLFFYHATFKLYKNYVTYQQNIARIAKRCPENITTVVKCVKLLFPEY